MMTNVQLYLAIGVPLVFNAVYIAILVASTNSRIDASQRFTQAGFDGINRRFDDMRDLWRAELRRVEEVLDARLTSLEKNR
jgi:hypothetical protein